MTRGPGRLMISTECFEPDGVIPSRHARDGDDVAPTLRIDGVPPGTVELAVICHDPDAPLPRGFTHWAVYGLDPATRTVGPEVDTTQRIGPNGWGERGWGGPQPPVGHGTHHYYFWVYALDRAVEGAPTREAFLASHADAILAQARVVGTFER